MNEQHMNPSGEIELPTWNIFIKDWTRVIAITLYGRGEASNRIECYPFIGLS